MKYLALIFLIFMHCSSKKENDLPISLEGDWIEVFEETEMIYDWSGLKFENDSAFRISDFGIFVKGPYSIFENHVVIDEFDGIFEFTIRNLTDDSLKIERNGKIIDYYSRRLEYNKDLKFNSISISTYKCMDVYWEFDYMLQNNGLEVFDGKYNTQTLGMKESKMNAKLLKEIDSLFKWSNIKELEPERIPIAVDGWLIDFEINFNENESIAFSTTSFGIPYRLKPIFYLIVKHLKEEGLK